MRTCKHCGGEIRDKDTRKLAKYCGTCRDLMKSDAFYFAQYMHDIKIHFESVGYPVVIKSAGYIRYNPDFLSHAPLQPRGKSRALTVFLRTCGKYEVISRHKYQRIGGGI